MEISLKDQVKAVNMAYRDARHDLAKARQNGDSEWIKDAEFVMTGLEAAATTLNSLLNFKLILGVPEFKSGE